MEVVIKPKHLKGNSWCHQDNSSRRMCPLFEALREENPNIAYVGANYISLKRNGNSEMRTFYSVDPSTWNMEIANNAIKAANNGSQSEIIVKYN